MYIFVIVQLLRHVQLFETPWTAVPQASLSFPISWSLPKLTSIESVMSSNHLVLCRPVLLLPSLFPSIRVFPNELALHIRCPKYWNLSFSISPSNEYSGLIQWMLAIYICYIFIISLSINECLDCFNIWLLKIMLQITWRSLYLFELVFLFSSNIYSEVELLDHMVASFNFLMNLYTIFHSGWTNLHLYE